VASPDCADKSMGIRKRGSNIHTWSKLNNLWLYSNTL
jgi:hypothetical protein